MKAATIRPCRRAVIVFSIIGGVIAIPGFHAFFWLGDIRGALIVAAGAGFASWYLIGLRISWDEEKLIYRQPFPVRRIAFRDISRFSTKRPQNYRGFVPVQSLSIYSGSSKRPVIVINTKPFSADDIKKLKMRLEEAASRNSL